MTAKRKATPRKTAAKKTPAKTAPKTAVEDVSKEALEDLLEDLEACDDGVEPYEGKTFLEAWRSLRSPAHAAWLFDQLDSQSIDVSTSDRTAIDLFLKKNEAPLETEVDKGIAKLNAAKTLADKIAAISALAEATDNEDGAAEFASDFSGLSCAIENSDVEQGALLKNLRECIPEAMVVRLVKALIKEVKTNHDCGCERCTYSKS